MVCYPDLKKMEVMINNVVSMFSPTDEKTLYEQGENPTVTLFSR